MALSDARILDAMKKGSIVIEPFDRENLATSSYDVTLGEHYFTEEHPSHFENIFNVYDKCHIDRVWGTEARKAKRAQEVFKQYQFEWNGIHPEEQVILMAPGETILAHTNEFIGGRNHITTMMKARSSLGRSFISVCKCAGWGDVGYTNRWTMEIQNTSTNYYIPLVVGRRIAQIIFFETGPIIDTDYVLRGKYQDGETLAELKRTWRPEMMLPRLDRDRDIRAGAERVKRANKKKRS